MAYEDYIVPSVWNRLQDDEPTKQRELLQGCSVKNLKDAVLNDLVLLFNSKRFSWKNIDKNSSLRKSILCYGLPDITSLSGRNSDDLMAISKEMTRLIDIFEPRLVDAKVVFVEADADNKMLNFLIEANLNVHPTPIPIELSTSFDTPSQTFDK